MPMNAEIKAQWIAALRSGDYKQGFNQLTTVHQDGSKTHCCLGVLCELAVKAGVVTSKQDYEPMPSHLLYSDGERFYLPMKVGEWAGIPNGKGSFVVGQDGGEHYSTLAAENDLGNSFSRIADIIEQHF